MKRYSLLLALLLTALVQSCARKNPEPAIETVHDTVTVVTRPAWTDTFVGYYRDDNNVNIGNQLALLKYISTDTIIFDMTAAGENHVFNIRTASFPVYFRYIEPDSIDLDGALHSSGGGLFTYNARKKR